MDNRLIFRYRVVGVCWERPGKAEPLSGWGWQAVNDRDAGGQPQKSVAPGAEKSPAHAESNPPVPQTDTGRRVEDTKANGRTRVKELGKIVL
jgi:hypothetical protein